MYSLFDVAFLSDTSGCEIVQDPQDSTTTFSIASCDPHKIDSAIRLVDRVTSYEMTGYALQKQLNQQRTVTAHYFGKYMWVATPLTSDF